jgi:glutamate dehydrogenase
VTTTHAPQPASTITTTTGPGPVVRFTDQGGLAPDQVRCVIAWAGEPPLVADTVSLFDSLGLRVARHASAPEGDSFDLLGWVGDAAEASDASARLTDAFRAVHLGHAERDGLNRLVLRAGIDWRQVAVVRALCRYLRQAGTALGLEYVEQTLLRNTDAVRALVALFEARFDPAPAEADDAEQRADAELAAALDAVATLDEDRVLRSLAEVVRATMRTSYHCRDASGAPLDRITLKIETGRLSFVAPPRPLVETWVYSPEVEGLHLRTARVARGGLRWSERPEDFRAEVLGLMKAQAVKNSVIVPAGAKGAFVVRRPLDGMSADAARSAVRRAYATFVRGLLDVTDNLVDGTEVPPARVRRHDDTDAYLVVAADKGTATFSDLANSVAAEYGFWLGDAFASGGSAGYDHKGMGITARGAWVSVEAHLREIGLDPAREELTVVGVGDLSGDVFGNGMLLSDRIRLVAAFDHRHIFLDPDPDPETSFAERRRVFDLPTSDWASYDAALISPGGGVHSRRTKRIPLTAQVKERLGIDPGRTSLTPDELVTAILSAPVSLLWNGGIGTYVKAADETHADAGDKANDPVRIDASRLRCRVVGEGGNLGLTQRARIEYARRGGRINADFVDNSAGVDTSDHEVNLKILIDAGIATGHFTTQERDQLLASMQESVAAAVLQDNHDQSLAISLAVRRGAAGLDRHARLIALLERDGGLVRQLEQLPEDEELTRRRARGEGLSRPEVATLLAWSKTSVRAALLDSDLPDEPAVQALLEAYFPSPVRDRDLILSHPLAREIAGTALANDLVNQVGPGFFCRLEERNGARLPEAAAAFFVARESLGLRDLWRTVCEHLGTAEVEVVFSALEQIQALQDQAANWLLRSGRGRHGLEREITTLAGQVAEVRGALGDALDEQQTAALEAATARLVAGGLPAATALRVAQCGPLMAALDVLRAASRAQDRPAYAAVGFFETGRLLDLDWLRACAVPDQRADHWGERAWAALTDDLMTLQGDLTAEILSRRSLGQCAPASAGCDHQDHRCEEQSPPDPRDLAARWAEQNAVVLDRLAVLRDELRSTPAVELPMLVVATQQMRELVGRAR